MYIHCTKPILSQPQNKAIKLLYDHLIQSFVNNDLNAEAMSSNPVEVPKL